MVGWIVGEVMGVTVCEKIQNLAQAENVDDAPPVPAEAKPAKAESKKRK